MFVEVEGEHEIGQRSLFVNLDRVTTAMLSADGKALTISFGVAQHTFRNETSIKTLLDALRGSQR
jgi:hypothetical protein